MKSLAVVPTFLIAIAFVLAPAFGPLEDAVRDAGSATSADYVPPATPAVDVSGMMADYKAWVKAYPVRDGNGAQHKAARDAIAAEFQALGLSLWRQPFTNGLAQENICAAKFGSVNPELWVVVGGHLDSTTQDEVGQPSPTHQVSEGAYDDGSGIWMMVGLARAYATIDNAYSILFCAFDGEERGLQGSARVRSAMIDGAFRWPVQDTRGMIEMDMYGLNWPLRAPIYIHENSAAVRTAVTATRIALGIPSDMVKFSDLRIAGVVALGSSDYVHWMSDGIPTAFFISDFNELGVPGTGLAPTVPVPTAPGVYPFWHMVDTWETMTAMAGGDATLQAGFSNGVAISSEVLATFALHPEISF